MRSGLVAMLALAAGACVNLPDVAKNNFGARHAECDAIVRHELGSGGKCATNRSTWRAVDSNQRQQRLNNAQPRGESL